MSSGPVRESSTGSVRSGPVSEISRGPVTAPAPLSSGSVEQHSQGAVKNNMDHSVGEHVPDLQRALAPLQEQLRARSEMEGQELQPETTTETESQGRDEDNVAAEPSAAEDRGEATEPMDGEENAGAAEDNGSASQIRQEEGSSAAEEDGVHKR